MSANICSNKHISTIANYVPKMGSDMSPIQAFQILAQENFSSVNYRYEENDACYSQYIQVPDVSWVQLVKAIDCLEYQSCEHPEWKTSKACEILQELREFAVKKILMANGYDDAEWYLED